MMTLYSVADSSSPQLPRLLLLRRRLLIGLIRLIGLLDRSDRSDRSDPSANETVDPLVRPFSDL